MDASRRRGADLYAFSRWCGRRPQYHETGRGEVHTGYSGSICPQERTDHVSPASRRSPSRHRGGALLGSPARSRAMNAEGLNQRLARGDVVILDGATGTELERRGVPMDGQAWSGTANLTHPDVVRGVHEDYIRAGADVVITNTFATARCNLEAAGLGERVAEVNRRAVELAREARDRAASGRDVWVAGSMSTMAPGSEPARRPSIGRLSEMLREQAEILALP